MSPFGRLKCSFVANRSSLRTQSNPTQLTPQPLSCFSKIPEPFHLYVTQFEESSRVYRFLDKYVNGVEHVGATVTSLSCVQVFPAKQLVYLSPDSPHDLEEYDPEDIFVIGGLVDKIVRKGASFDVARTHKIRTARFPIKLNARIKAEGSDNTLLFLISYVGYKCSEMKQFPSNPVG